VLTSDEHADRSAGGQAILRVSIPRCFSARMCAGCWPRYGMGVLPWSSLAGRWLTGRYRKGRQAPASRCAEFMPAQYDLSDPDNRHKLETAEALAVVAENAGMSLVHMALARGYGECCLGEHGWRGAGPGGR
jgi:hypothetical protein